MSLTFSQTPGNGVNLSFPITNKGGYFTDDDIVVEFITLATGEVAEQSPSTYEISSGFVIFTVAPPDTVDVRIRRRITLDNPYSTFTRGNDFGKDNINKSFLQALYQIQQIADGFLPSDYYLKADLNAGARKITNLADGSDPQDVCTYGQLDNRFGDNTQNLLDAQTAQAAAEYAQALAEAAQALAETARSGAETARTGAETAETNAETAQAGAELAESNAAASAVAANASAVDAQSSEDDAETAQLAAETAETNAAGSAAAALTSENNAATSESNAAASAANALTSENNAETSESNAATSETNAAQSASDAWDYLQTITAVDPTKVAANTAHREITSGNPHGVTAAMIGAAAILAQLLTVDGDGSGLDADKLGGVDNSLFLQTANLLTQILAVDGPGSGINADLLDGQHGSYYLAAATYTAADILAKLKTVDGAGSGLDADLLDGHTSTYFQPAGTAFSGAVSLKGTRSESGTWTLSGLTVGKPLYLGIRDSSGADGRYVEFRVVSGAYIASGLIDSVLFSMRASSSENSSNPGGVVTIPYDTTVSIYFKFNGVTVYAYQ
jgi:plasmid stabilization system protein ParE